MRKPEKRTVVLDKNMRGGGGIIGREYPAIDTERREVTTKYGKMWEMIEGGIRMVVWVGLVCFVLGANLGFLVAGLMRMAKDEKDTSEKP